ncbi:hypothetical protein [Stieleria neptunia]|uniref:hypothetical protein n=1 Tax=Stieleria neptunia TaxID=2527979 RepID=UPI0011A16BC1|nr:hypothetical protein [Stieleria neptunia]
MDAAMGDEITIRIPPAGEYDEPDGRTDSPRKTIDDADFGQLNCYIDSFDKTAKRTRWSTSARIDER